MAIVECPDGAEHAVPFPRNNAASKDYIWNFSGHWVFSDPQLQKIIQHEWFIISEGDIVVTNRMQLFYLNKM